MDANEHNVFLKLQAFDAADGLSINTIPLKAESVDFTTDKTIPTFPIPLSGAITGEATTIALDLGMSNKTVSVKGVITEQTITKKHGTGLQPLIKTIIKLLKDKYPLHGEVGEML